MRGLQAPVPVSARCSTTGCGPGMVTSVCVGLAAHRGAVYERNNSLLRRVLGVMIRDAQLHVVMPLYERGSLAQRIAGHGAGLEAAEVVEVAVQVLEGLAELHERGVVHRGVKPGNVLSKGVGCKLVVQGGRITNAQDGARCNAGYVELCGVTVAECRSHGVVCFSKDSRVAMRGGAHHGVQERSRHDLRVSGESDGAGRGDHRLRSARPALRERRHSAAQLVHRDGVRVGRVF